jgi:hypothetical protein
MHWCCAKSRACERWMVLGRPVEPELWLMRAMASVGKSRAGPRLAGLWRDCIAGPTRSTRMPNKGNSQRSFQLAPGSKSTRWLAYALRNNRKKASPAPAGGTTTVCPSAIRATMAASSSGDGDCSKRQGLCMGSFKVLITLLRLLISCNSLSPVKTASCPFIGHLSNSFWGWRVRLWRIWAAKLGISTQIKRKKLNAAPARNGLLSF